MSQPPAVQTTPFGRLSTGEEVDAYILTNASGMSAGIISYGATVAKLRTPDRQGNPADVVLGFDGPEGYERQAAFIGPVIGRVAGRIAGGKLSIAGLDYALPVNNGPNHLHGGPGGFHRVNWRAEASATTASVTLRHASPDGDQGYPGHLEAEVSYTLTEENELRVDYRAVTDRATVVNLTQHSYFNLSGDPSGTVLDHRLQVRASNILEIDECCAPTGRLLNVRGTPFDFRAGQMIGRALAGNHQQLAFGSGLDHFWVLDEGDGREPGPAAVLYDPASGRSMEVFTSAPGLQIYSANAMPLLPEGKGGVAYGPRSGICLEAQVHPDAPSHPGFPPILLAPGDEYRQTTRFCFSTRDE